MLPHAASQVHGKPFTARCADESSAGEVGFQIHFAATRSGFELHPHQIVSAFGMHSSPALPEGHDVEFSTEVKRPGIEQAGHRREENRARNQHQHGLSNASEASFASLPSWGLRQWIL